MNTLANNWYLSGELHIESEASNRPDKDAWQDHFGHSNIWGKFTKIATVRMWGLQNCYGLLQNWDTDSLFIGLKNEGSNRKDAVIAFGDDADESLRFLFAGAGAPPPEPKELLRITSNGSVGIGTTNPTHPLHVKTNWGFLALDSNAAGQDSGLRLMEGGAVKWHIWNSANDAKFNIVRDGLPASLTIDQSGNVDIGATNPIRFSSGWTGSPDSVTNRAEISNDTGGYKTLMIIGNKSAGMGRRVSVWDRLEVNGELTTLRNVVIGAGSNASLKTRHIDGKHYQNDQPDGLHLNWSNGQPVHVGGEGGDGKESNLHVHGNIFWKSDRSDINFIRLGNLLICWGSLTIPVFSNRTNQWETQNQVNFPTQFSVTPVVTISLNDPGIYRNVVDTVVGSYQVTNSGFIALTKRIPLGGYDPREGYIIINWIAIGR